MSEPLVVASSQFPLSFAALCVQCEDIFDMRLGRCKCGSEVSIPVARVMNRSASVRRLRVVKAERRS